MSSAAALLLASSGSVLACSRGAAPKIVDNDVSADYVSTPEVLLGEGRDSLIRVLEGCSGSVDVDMQVDLPAFNFVRMVQFRGRSYPAYELHRSSPLFILHYSYNNYSSHVELPLATGASSYRFRSVNGNLATSIVVYVMSRGGGMLSVPYGDLGTVTVTPRSNPGVSHVTSIRMGLQLRTPTCMLSDTLVNLSPRPGDELSVIGSAAPAEAFPVRMTCVSDGVKLNLLLADANAPGGTGSLLAPAAGSDASGVQIELLHNGAPVALGKEWAYQDSMTGDQFIPFSARYVRVPGSFQPGSIIGEALLSVDYN